MGLAEFAEAGLNAYILLLGGKGPGSVLQRQDRGVFCSRVPGCRGILVPRGNARDKRSPTPI